MKKGLLSLVVIILVLVAGVYVLIPAKITIASAVVVKTTDIGAERYIVDDTKWGLWWHYDSTEKKPVETTSGKLFSNGAYSFTQTGKFYKASEISIQKGDIKILSKMVIVPLSVDSTGVEWKCEIITGNNPVTRMTQYLEAKQIKQSMDEVLGNLKAFLAKPENVYGINIEKNFLKDTLYISTKQVLPYPPSNKEIFALIDKVKTFLTQNQTEPSGSPIYNVTQMDQGKYQLMVAVPTNKSVPETSEFSKKVMIKGSFMITEVVGGDSTIKASSKQLQQYFQDYRKTSMAMNFTMLVTDRMLQPDSSKWVTKLYMPVY